MIEGFVRQAPNTEPLRDAVNDLLRGLHRRPVEERADVLQACRHAVYGAPRPGVFHAGDPVAFLGTDQRVHHGLDAGPGRQAGHRQVWVPGLPAGQGHDIPAELLRHGRPMRHIETSRAYVIDPVEAQQQLIHAQALVQDPRSATAAGHDLYDVQADRDALWIALAEWSGTTPEDLQTHLAPAVARQINDLHANQPGTWKGELPWPSPGQGPAQRAGRDTPPGMNPIGAAGSAPRPGIGPAATAISAGHRPGRPR